LLFLSFNPDSILVLVQGMTAMMGPRQQPQSALFYDFLLEDHLPQDHLLRAIDRFVDLGPIRYRHAHPSNMMAQVNQNTTKYATVGLSGLGYP